jgi:hypothetical protein
MSHTAAHSTTETLDRALVALLSDAQAADRLTDHLSDDLGWDVGLELLAARASIQRAIDLLNALPAMGRYDAEPRSAGAVHSYA